MTSKKLELPPLPEFVQAGPFKLDMGAWRRLKDDVIKKQREERSIEHDDEMRRGGVFWGQIEHMEAQALKVFQAERIQLTPQHLRNRCYQIVEEYEFGACEAAEFGDQEQWAKFAKEHEQRYGYRPFPRSQISLAMYLAAQILRNANIFKALFADAQSKATRPHEFAMRAMRIMEIFSLFRAHLAFQEMSAPGKARDARAQKIAKRRSDIATVLNGSAPGALTKAQLARQFNISAKTINRYLEQDAELRKLAKKCHL